MPTYNNVFAINGLIDTGSTVLQNLQEICTASGVWLVYDINLGKWDVVINTTGNSVKSFTDNNIIGNIDLMTTSLTEYYNQVEIKFPHKDILDQADYEDFSIPANQFLPNEKLNRLSLSSDLINNPVQAQLIAARELKQSRIDKVIKFTTDFTSLGLRAGDIISVSTTMYGFNNKLFRITTLEESDLDDGGLGIVITALEYSSTVYDTSGLVYTDRTIETGIRSAAGNSDIINSDNQASLKVNLSDSARLAGLGLTFNNQSGKYDLNYGSALAKITADFAIITWAFQDGEDLDIRCRVYSPNIQTGIENYLGYTGGNGAQFPPESTLYWPPGSDLNTALLVWGGDNTGVGGNANSRESVLVNVSRFQVLYPTSQYMVVECRGNWYTQPGTKTVYLDAEIYTGGTVSRSGFGFTVTSSTQQVDIQGVEVFVTSYAGNGENGQPPGGETTLGDFMGYLMIDVVNKTAQFRNDLVRLE